MGVWSWLSATQQNALRPRALEGRHWMLTPWRDLEVVHAVQRPLLAPEILQLRIQRGFGSTSAQPMIDAAVSIKSTDRVDVMAGWHEPAAADPGTPGTDRARTDRGYSVKITDGTTFAGEPEHLTPQPDRIRAGQMRDHAAAKRHEFNDTRYRRIEYWLEATSRFREYMPAAPTGGEPGALGLAGCPHRGPRSQDRRGRSGRS